MRAQAHRRAVIFARFNTLLGDRYFFRSPIIHVVLEPTCLV
jgi:hypothetical protein